MSKSLFSNILKLITENKLALIKIELVKLEFVIKKLEISSISSLLEKIILNLFIILPRKLN